MSEKKGGQESKKGKPRSAGKSKGKIAGYYSSGRLALRKLRRIVKSHGRKAAELNIAQTCASIERRLGPVAARLKESELGSLLKGMSGIAALRESAAERRRAVREARAALKLEWARARHEAERAAQAAQKKADELKAKRSAAAKKAAATKAARKAAAKLAAEQSAAETQSVAQ